MTLQDDDFTLFELPRRFAQTRAQIDQRWHALQRQAHPDGFTDQGAAAQRLALQWSVRINQAHQRLRDPLQRAAYLCELAGVAVDAERNTAMPAAFLMQQMAWHEALEQADSASALQALQHQVQQVQQQTLENCRRLLDDQHDAAAAVLQVRVLMFIERLLTQVEAALDDMAERSA